MDVNTFFLQALKERSYVKKDWIYRVFSVVKQDESKPYPYRVDYLESTVGGWVPVGDELVFTPFVDRTPSEPLLRFLDHLTIGPDDVPTASANTKTTYGNVLVNWMVLIHSFGNKVPFMTGKIRAKEIEKIVEKRMINGTPGEATEYAQSAEEPIYVNEWIHCADALGQVAGLSNLCVPSATAKAITPPPGIVEYRRKLYEQFAGKLNDPAVVAEIDRLLVEFDKAWLGDDDIVNFYIKGKSYDVIRKKLFLSHGLEAGFSENGEFDLVPNSLYEGWDMDKLPAMVNSLRDGSYNRGAMTALGGWSVKFFYRIMQNAKINEDNCNATMGIRRLVTAQNRNQFYGYYYIEGGKTKPFDDESLDRLTGAVVTMRSPMFCKTDGSGFCKVCLGDTNSENPTALGALAAEVGSQFMLWRMGAMHGTSLKTTRYNHRASLS